MLGGTADKSDLCVSVGAQDAERDGGVRLSCLEAAPLKDARKEASSERLVEPRIRVATGNEDAFSLLAMGRPLDAATEAALRADPRAGARAILNAIARRRFDNRSEGQRLRKLLRYETDLLYPPARELWG